MSQAAPGQAGQARDGVQNLIAALCDFWGRQGCVVLQSHDRPMGAGTFHPATFLASLGPRPHRAVYPQLCRRPADGRYGDNPNRLGQYYQLQVLLKPPPADFQEQYLASLAAIGIDIAEQDLRFVEDNWASPSLAAWGLGWEVWLNGMEITQFTYFQQVGGVGCDPPSGEITYGVERLAMYLQGVESVYDLRWNREVSYGDLFLRNEREMSRYSFELAPIEALQRRFDEHVEEALGLMDQGLGLVATDLLMEASHEFNLLDARRALSPSERQRRILALSGLARRIAEHETGGDKGAGA